MVLSTITLIFCSLIILLMGVGIFTGKHTFTRYVALGFDMFWNVITGGSIDMTISARAGVAAVNGKKWGKLLAWCLGKLEANHCNLAIEGDIDRAKALIAELAPYDQRTKNS